MSKSLFVALVFSMLALPLQLGASEAPDASGTFAQLRTLVGRWEGTYADGKTHQVEYRMTAGNTVLVEMWTMSPTRESMTIYHVDGDRLLATHYCPQGSQPRLVLTGRGKDGALEFTFLDGTGLGNPAGSHQRAMWLQMTDDGFRRGETYVGNADKGPAVDRPARGEAVVYRRVKTASTSK